MEPEKMDYKEYKTVYGKYTYEVEYIEKIPSKKYYEDAIECANAGLQYGQSRFASRLVKVSLLRDGQIIDSWQQRA